MLLKTWIWNLQCSAKGVTLGPIHSSSVWWNKSHHVLPFGEYNPTCTWRTSGTVSTFYPVKVFYLGHKFAYPLVLCHWSHEQFCYSSMSKCYFTSPVQTSVSMGIKCNANIAIVAIACIKQYLCQFNAH